jgi:hypothetical protein
MSKNLNAKIDEPHTLRAFEKEWPLSNDDKKLMKKQQEHQDALDHFFSKMDKDVGEQNKFLNRVWSNKAKMPSLYPEKSLTWEARIFNAFNEADIDIGMWFAEMANDKKAVYGTGAGGWFVIRERKEIFFFFTLLKLYQIMTMRKNTSTLR